MLTLKCSQFDNDVCVVLYTQNKYVAFHAYCKSSTFFSKVSKLRLEFSQVNFQSTTSKSLEYLSCFRSSMRVINVGFVFILKKELSFRSFCHHYMRNFG